MRDVPIDELLGGLGLADKDARAAARAALEDAGLTRPGKTRISVEKRAAVVAALAEGLALSCPSARCREAAAAAHPDSPAVVVSTGRLPDLPRLCEPARGRRARGRLRGGGRRPVARRRRLARHPPRARRDGR